MVLPQTLLLLYFNYAKLQRTTLYGNNVVLKKGTEMLQNLDKMAKPI